MGYSMDGDGFRSHHCWQGFVLEKIGKVKSCSPHNRLVLTLYRKVYSWGGELARRRVGMCAKDMHFASFLSSTQECSPSIFEHLAEMFAEIEEGLWAEYRGYIA